MIEATNDPQKIGQALGWIVSLLNRYSISYQICGGMAAKAYGATRPLVDIDIYMQRYRIHHIFSYLWMRYNYISSASLRPT